LSVNQEVFFVAVLDALDKSRVPYMIAGSVAAMLYGEPPMTNDMDIAGVLRLSAGRIDLQYVESWVVRLGLQDAWHAATRCANAGR
jgi:hypothetical protein